MGGATLPTASTSGYGWFRAKVACDCLAAWLTAAERLGLARGLIKYELDIVQLTGTAAASAGTHSAGGAFDVKQCSRDWSHLFREMGAAAWPRVGVDWVNNEHLHGVLDCPHNDPAAYQVTAYWRGYSGLGKATSGTYAGMWGYGSKDPDPWRPAVRRTRREGIAWANAQTAAITAAAQEDDDMAMTPAERQALINDIRDAVWSAPLLNHDPNTKDDVKPSTYAAKSYVVMGNWRGSDVQNSVVVIRRMLADIAAKVGVDVDEKALAAQIVASLTPAVRQAVLDSGQPDAVADAVVAKLGAALTPPA
jgi:hypothetical protein